MKGEPLCSWRIQLNYLGVKDMPETYSQMILKNNNMYIQTDKANVSNC